MSSDKTKATALVRLGELSSETFSTLVRNLPEDMAKKIKLSPEQVKLLEAHLANDGTLGLKNRLPLLCKGSTCPYASICVYQQTGIAPIGHGCPEERIIIEKMIPALITDLQVDVDSTVELDMLTEYLDAELQEIRAQKELAIKGQTQEVVTAVDQSSGVPYYETKESSSLSIKERAQKRKAQFRKDFLATREQRAKFKLDETKDKASEQSEKRARYEELLKRNPQRFVDVLEEKEDK